MNKQEEELYYRLALVYAAQIGDRFSRVLLQHFGSAKSIFYANPARLASIEGFGEKKIQSLRSVIDERRVLTEMAFIVKHNILPLFITDTAYPERLKGCADAPVLLYYKGNTDLNSQKIVAVIGTRRNTEYGQRVTEELVSGLAGRDIVLVSGLAYGIDIIAHQRALQCGIPTIGVMAHGMDRVYPAQHKHITREMVGNGGLLTEYPSGTEAERYNFPMRNRIVAGMCDVTVVIETEKKGGAMITAKLATGYNREVAAFPGRTIDKKSQGCNYLLQTQMAQMITRAEDLLEMMNWDQPARQQSVQSRLFTQLSTEESGIACLLQDTEGMHIDELQLKSGMNATSLSAVLLQMELNGILKSLPGKRYRLL